MQLIENSTYFRPQRGSPDRTMTQNTEVLASSHTDGEGQNIVLMYSDEKPSESWLQSNQGINLDEWC